MTLYDSEGTMLNVRNIFEETARILGDGGIVAVKGIGGVHLTALATTDDVVNELRKRKGRPNQPFAVMSPSINDIQTFASPTEVERSLISSWRKPIVLIEKRHGGSISEWVSPGLDRGES
jgi:hydrogenase maturation protein HypF